MNIYLHYLNHIRKQTSSTTQLSADIMEINIVSCNLIYNQYRLERMKGR
jgi:hypothetical protein